MEKSFKRIADMHFFIGHDEKGNTLVDSDKYNAWVDCFIGNLFLSQEEKEMIDQGLLEIKEKNFKEIKDSPIENPGNEEIETHKRGVLYLISSLERTFLPKGELSKKNYNCFDDFLCHLSKEKENIDFKKYILTENESNHFKETLLIPSRFLYKDALKITCLIDNSNNDIFIVGFSPIQPLNSDLFLKKIMQETISIQPIYKNPLFFSLEMDLKQAAYLLGYSIEKLSKLLDNGTIYSRGASGFAEFNPLGKPDDPRKIPLQELHSYIEKSNDENKEEKILALLEYMDCTSKAIVGELESSKIPHPLSGNDDFLSLKKEYEVLKKENKELKLKLEDSQTTTSKNRKKYIEIATSEIINIIVETEKNKAQGNHDKFKLPTKKDFLKKLKERGCPDSGENVAIIIFETLPQGEYRRSRGH